VYCEVRAYEFQSLSRLQEETCYEIIFLRTSYESTIGNGMNHH